MPQAAFTLKIDETADIHPSAILEGNITIGAFTKIGAGVVMSGEVTIGHHTLVQCNTVIRGRNAIGNAAGRRWVHIYDQVCIEGGRPGNHAGGATCEEADRSIIGDECWLNHGAIMHGSRIDDGGVLDLAASAPTRPPTRTGTSAGAPSLRMVAPVGVNAWRAARRRAGQLRRRGCACQDRAREHHRRRS